MKFKLFLFVMVFTLSCSTSDQSKRHRVPAQDSQAASFNQASFLPKLNTLEDKIKFLIYLKSNLPSLFKDAASYDINLFSILDDQSKLQELLFQNEEFKSKFQSDQRLLSAEFSLLGEVQSNEYTFDLKSINEFKKGLIEELEKLSNDIPVEEQILQAINSASKQVDIQKPDGLLNGLIQALDGQIRSEVYKEADQNKKIALLREHLPRTLEGRAFDASKFPLSSLDTVTVLSFLEESLNNQNKLMKLSALYTALVNPDHSIDDSLENAIERIQNLNQNDVSSFLDNDWLKPRLKHLEKISMGISGPNPQLKKMGSSLKKWFQLSFKKSTKTKSVSKSKISIKEVPPKIAIFRGCSGGDCSSQYSFPYPNDPNERVFFIYDTHDHLKGYVSATVVNTNGTKALYVITVSGDRVNSLDTEIILNGLDSIKEELGVDSIILPSSQRLNVLLNMLPIRGVFQNSLGNERVNIEYKGSEIRRLIEGFESKYNKGTYDHMSNNIDGHYLKPNRAIKSNLTSSVAYSNILVNDLPALDKADVIELCIDLFNTNRAQVVREILPHINIQFQDFNKLIEILAGESGSSPESQYSNLTLSEFEFKLSKVIADIGLDEDFFSKRKYLLNEGRLRTLDAFHPENIKSSARLLVETIKLQETDLEYFYKKIIAENFEALSEETHFLNYMFKIITSEDQEEREIASSIFHSFDFYKPLSNKTSKLYFQKLTDHFQNTEKLIIHLSSKLENSTLLFILLDNLDASKLIKDEFDLVMKALMLFEQEEEQIEVKLKVNQITDNLIDPYDYLEVKAYNFLKNAPDEWKLPFLEEALNSDDYINGQFALIESLPPERTNKSSFKIIVKSFFPHEKIIRAYQHKDFDNYLSLARYALSTFLTDEARAFVYPIGTDSINQHIIKENYELIIKDFFRTIPLENILDRNDVFYKFLVHYKLEMSEVDNLDLLRKSLTEKGINRKDLVSLYNDLRISIKSGKVFSDTKVGACYTIMSNFFFSSN